ncbi:MAG: Sodium:alanine symporter family protein [bacterium ADurb.Bin243]|nr:MAG: Sodium:alanine symporter family protein [bacterium ADurb.Bin243]
MVGSIVSLPLVWDFADMMNALMAIPNLVALLALNGVIVAETKKYLWDGNIEDDETAPKSVSDAANEVAEEEFKMVAAATEAE